MKDTRFLTFGCRLNAYETQAMRDRARDAGLEGAVIVNSCAVTGEAVRQARQAIRRARRESPHAKIIVTGCAAQTQPEVFTAMPEVDHVIGNGEKLSAAMFSDLADGSAERQRVGDIMQRAETAHHFIDGFGSRARAYVQVQNGCDHRCTFCIIPFGRGPSRSQPADTIITQVRDLVARGHAEIVLTGVDITAYGADFGGELSLGGLVRAILRQVPELRRLRLSSIDTIEADADLLAAIADEDRLMPHLHLSLQSGDDMILKRMRRRHSRADAVAFCDTARRLRPEITFGADLIAGFPTSGHVREYNAPCRGLRFGVPACVSLLAASRNAGRAHAAARAATRQGARPAPAPAWRHCRDPASQPLCRANRRIADGKCLARPRRGFYGDDSGSRNAGRGFRACTG
jgi:threonylcarbamoyladenosine tRNA methylthiotransferase MtaB